MLQRLVRLRSLHVLVDHQHDVFLFWFQSFYCSPTKEINPNMDNESFPMKTDGWCTWWWHCWIVAISSQHHIKHSWRKHHAAHKANDFSEDFWFSFLGCFWILVSNVFFFQHVWENTLLMICFKQVIPDMTSIHFLTAAAHWIWFFWKLGNSPTQVKRDAGIQLAVKESVSCLSFNQLENINQWWTSINKWPMI